MTEPFYKRVLIFTDAFGMNQLRSNVPSQLVCGIVGAGIRPESHEKLKQQALAWEVPFFIQPKKSDSKWNDFLSQISELSADSIICHSYAQKLPKELLELVDGFAVNVHFSLLPKNRGPNPVQWAIINGDQETGVSIHLMEEGFDTGAILFQSKTSIAPEDTWVSLHKQLTQVSSQLLETVIPKILANDITAIPQDENCATTNHRLHTDSPLIQFEAQTNEQIHRLIRAQIAPLSGAYYLNSKGQKIRIDQMISIEDIEKLRNEINP